MGKRTRENERWENRREKQGLLLWLQLNSTEHQTLKSVYIFTNFRILNLVIFVNILYVIKRVEKTASNRDSDQEFTAMKRDFIAQYFGPEIW